MFQPQKITKNTKIGRLAAVKRSSFFVIFAIFRGKSSFFDCGCAGL